MIKIGIVGITGKMGTSIYQSMKKETQFHIVGGYAKNKTDLPIKLFTDLSVLIQECDLLIDFSSPDLFASLISCAVDYHKPLIIGTTGYDEEQKKMIEEMSKKIPIFYSPNFSLGIALMKRLFLSFPSSFLKDMDIDIIETHHKEKKDRPSGTALFLKNLLPQDCKNISIQSLRHGQVVGEHRTLFQLPNESIEITHRAFSRETFSDGVIKAAHFLMGKKAGFYTLDDLIDQTQKVTK